MRLSYFPETDSLYLELVERPGVATGELADGVLADYDADGVLVGIDIDRASAKVDLRQLVLSRMPNVVQDPPA